MSAILTAGGAVFGYRLIDSSSGDYYPDWSPDGDSLVFERIDFLDRQLWLTSADGSVQRRLTQVGSNGTPAWSPAGDRIAFESKRDGNREIYLIDVVSGAETNVSMNGAEDWGPPAWSPDGTRLVFASDRDGDRDLFVLAIESGAVQKLADSDSADSYPSWSPDGRMIA